MSGSGFIERLIGRLETLDSKNIEAYVKRLGREIDFLETLFNTVHEGIIIIDRRLRIRYVNRAAESMLGLPGEVESQPIGRYLRGIDWAHILRNKDGSWHRLARQEIEVLYPAHRNLLVYLVPHETHKDTAIVILQDVTESRQRTAKQVESGKLHSMSLLAAGVAHEIGNPLNSLHIHLQLLERRLSSLDHDDNELDELLEVARSEADRLNTILTQFLEAIRSVRPSLNPLSPRLLLEGSLRLLEREISERNICVECFWPDERLPSICGDENQLRQAFYNIIRNAIQAMPDGGDLEISCVADDDYVNFAVADTGKGVSPEDIGSIFEPYYTTRSFGSGLGLMIVERIVRENGGELSVESEVGSGTVFTVRLPRSERRLRLLPSGESAEPRATRNDNDKRA